MQVLNIFTKCVSHVDDKMSYDHVFKRLLIKITKLNLRETQINLNAKTERSPATSRLKNLLLNVEVRSVHLTFEKKSSLSLYYYIG